MIPVNTGREASPSYVYTKAVKSNWSNSSMMGKGSIQSSVKPTEHDLNDSGNALKANSQIKELLGTCARVHEMETEV